MREQVGNSDVFA